MVEIESSSVVVFSSALASVWEPVSLLGIESVSVDAPNRLLDVKVLFLTTGLFWAVFGVTTVGLLWSFCGVRSSFHMWC